MKIHKLFQRLHAEIWFWLICVKFGYDQYRIVRTELNLLHPNWNSFMRSSTRGFGKHLIDVNAQFDKYMGEQK